jgi:hypothetical protein
MKKILALVALGAVAAASQAQFTVATHDDPSGSAANPVVTWNQTANTLSASWLATGMTLDTPGLTGGGSTANAKLSMNPVSLTNLGGGVYQMGAGLITFTGGLFVDPIAAGSGDIQGFNVTFSGPNVPGGWSQEAFSYALTNRSVSGNNVTYTAAFTSSAVPEPATMIALGAGLAAFAARRRRK